MADPYNAATAAANAQLFGSSVPAALPPQFVGRYPGAPVPQPAAPASVPPVAPTFVPRYDTNALRSVVAPPAPGVVQPANAASTPPAPAPTPINPLQITPIAPGITPERGKAFVAGLDNFVPQQQRTVGQSPTIGADGQWNVPPLPASMQGDDGGTPLPADDVGGSPGAGTWAATAMSRQGNAGYGGYGGGAAAGRGLVDPEARINAGFDRQNATASEFMNKALDYIQQGGNIFERATRGRAIASILHAVMGPNNVGQVQGQGIDSLNAANAGITQSENYANANMYGSDNALTGHLTDVAERQHEADTGSVPVGTGIEMTQFGPVPVTRYGQRPARAGAMPSPYDTSPGKPTLQQFLQKARTSNPGRSDEELTTYYNKTYGN